MVAFLVFRQPAPQPVVIQMPPTATAPATGIADDVPPPPPTVDSAPAPTDSATPAKRPTGGQKVAAAPTSTQRAADLSGLVGSSGGSGPAVGGNSSGGAQPSGGGFDQAAVERVVANHRAGVKRSCWERNSGPDQKSSVNVTVNATVAPNGSVSSTSSSGDDPIVAKCIESQVKTWTFPAPGESKQIALPFKFVRQ
jgi:membrane protein involved in colicin uptake